MTSVSGGGNYLSDGAILEWLATQQDRLYGDLRDSMRSSEARAAFTDELNDIKAALHHANRSQEHDFAAVDQKMQAFLSKYGDDPEFAELCEGLKPLMSQVHDDNELRQKAAADTQRYVRELAEFEIQGGDRNGPKVQYKTFGSNQIVLINPDPPMATPPATYSDDLLKEWDDLIGGKLDVAGKNDQITMIHIQQLKSTIDQSSQFGSQFIASGDKTSSSIINNIA